MQGTQCINGHFCPQKNSTDTAALTIYNNALLPSQNCLPSTPKDAPLVVVFIAKTKVRIIKPLESTSSHSSMLLSFYSFVFPWSVETESEKSDCGSGVVVALFLHFSLYSFVFLWSVQKESEKSGCGSIYLFLFLCFSIFLIVEKVSEKVIVGQE